MDLNQTIMASMTYAERVAAADAAGLVNRVDTAAHTGTGTFMDPMSHAERVAAAAATNAGVEDVIPGGIDYPYYPPSFYEQHKTKLFIVGGVAAILLVGGGALAVRRARSGS